MENYNNKKAILCCPPSGNAIGLFVTKCIAAAVCTKNSNWNDEQYEKGVAKPFGRLKEIEEEFEKHEGSSGTELMLEAANLLKIIFHTKKVPATVQKERFSQIFSETGTTEIFNDFKI